ncbi:ABC transporter permease [Membranihabitans marinus]|uniref:ABC transporter permease n=1 Tax=Membranihabitans marinus TaxID=1227546 RepID=UPI001F02C670|nr:ABC transporter permease subunit [Membranihabitans marinus]
MKTLENISLRTKYQNIGLLFFAVLGIIPFALSFIYALLYSLGLVGVANSGFTIEHWQEILESGEFIKSFGFSAFMALIAMVFSVGIALWLTLLFHKKIQHKTISFLLYLPLALPGVVSAFFAVQILSKSGYFSRWFYQIGWIKDIQEFPDLINDDFGFGIILTFVSVVMPFFLLLFIGVFKTERIAELESLAASLGSRPNQIIRRITIPLLLHKTWPLIALYYIFLLGAYEIPLILGQESPQMLSVLIVRELKQFDLTKISEGYVVAVIYTVLVTIMTLFLFLRRKSIRIDG